jgi:hypothetical protein
MKNRKLLGMVGGTLKGVLAQNKYRTIALCVNMLRKLLLSIVATISGFLSLLIAIYPDAIRQAISSFLNMPDVTIAFNALIISLILLFIVCVIFLIYSVYAWHKYGITIQKDSFRFNKYPYYVSSHGRVQKMTNMSYAEVTIHNSGKNKIGECSLEISLRRENEDIYVSKVLSSDSTEKPNPMTVSVDGDGRKGFHPICLRLDSFEAFLPNHSLDVGGAFTGILVAHGEYEIFGRVLHNGKCGKWTPIGKIKIPNDFVDKAKIPNDIQVIIAQGGFACYAELYQGKIRARFYGNPSDGDIRQSLEGLKNIDDMIEVNGTVKKRPPLIGAFRFG